MDWGNILTNAAQSLVNIDTIVFALAAIGLNVHFGYAGLLNFGQAAFVAIGAYGIGIMVQTFGLSIWIGVLVGLVGSVVLALLLGIPTLRLRADYLAIATIAAAEIVRLLVRSSTLREYTGGSNGRNGFSDGFYAANPFAEGTYGFGPWQFSHRGIWVLTVGWIVVALACVVVFLLMRSPWGRVLKGIREDEDAVRSLGKNVYAFKMQALVIGGVIGTLAGFISALGKSLGAAGQLLDRVHLLRLHRAAARWCRAGARPGRRCDDLLGGALADRHRAAAGDRRGLPAVPHHATTPAPSASSWSAWP